MLLEAGCYNDFDVYNTLEKSLLGVTGGNPEFCGLRKTSSRYEMTAKEQASLCTGLTSSTKILYPRVTAKDLLVPTTKAVDE